MGLHTGTTANRRRPSPRSSGSSWFQWIDQPSTGRMDGDNHNIGLVDVTDRPYRELIDAMRTTHRRLQSVHSGKIAPFDTIPRAQQPITRGAPPRVPLQLLSPHPASGAIVLRPKVIGICCKSLLKFACGACGLSGGQVGEAKNEMPIGPSRALRPVVAELSEVVNRTRTVQQASPNFGKPLSNAGISLRIPKFLQRKRAMIKNFRIATRFTFGNAPFLRFGCFGCLSECLMG